MYAPTILDSARLAECIRILAKERTLSVSDAIDLHLRAAHSDLCETGRREARGRLISVLALNMPKRAAA